MQQPHLPMHDQLAAIKNLVTQTSPPTPEIAVTARETEHHQEHVDFQDSSHTMPGDLANPPEYRKGQSRSRQYGRTEASPAQVKVQIGASTTTVPLSGAERDAVVGNVLALQRVSVQREKAGIWSSIATATLSLIGILGLGIAMAKGVSDKTQNKT